MRLSDSYVSLYRIGANSTNFNPFLAKLLKLSLFLSVVLLLGLGVGCLLSVALALSPSSVAKLQTHHFVDDSEDHLEHFESLSHRLLGAANFDLRSHEDRVLVVNLLVCHMKL